MTKRRYCGMCDKWVPANQRECKSCGADTDKADDAPALFSCRHNPVPSPVACLMCALTAGAATMTPPDDLRALADKLERVLPRVPTTVARQVIDDLRALAAAQQTPQEPCNCRMGMPPIGAVAEAHEPHCARLQSLSSSAHETPAPRPAEDTTP